MKYALMLLLVVMGGAVPAEVLYWMGDASENEIDYVYARVGVVSAGDTETVITYLNDVDGNPSYLGNEGGYLTGASWADLGSYSSSEYAFFVEIQNYGVLNTDPTGEDQWYTAGVSQFSSYQDLVSSGYVYVNSLAAPNITGAWAPAVSVPEPTSGLLMLLGTSLLLLRRRRQD